VEVAAMSRTSWLSIGLVSSILAAAVQADELPLAAEADAEAEAISQLIQQLDEPGFAARQEASARLTEVGPAAIPHLELAAASRTRETSTRALDILKQHFHRGDEAARQAASDVLQRLAIARDPATAQRARHILSPPPPPSIPSSVAAIPNLAFPPAFNGQLQLGGVRRVHIQEAAGRRHVEVEDASRRVRMETRPNGRIDVQITEKQNGRDRTRNIEARDFDDLKRQDPEAAKTYEQYHQGLRLGGNPLGMALPRNAANLPFFPSLPGPRAFQR
jgi:hypothetical protein